MTKDKRCKQVMFYMFTRDVNFNINKRGKNWIEKYQNVTLAHYTQ